jgi:small-conductance mechanosensitive channel
MLSDIEAALDSVPYLIELVATLITWVSALVFIRFNSRLFKRVGDELDQVEVDDRSLKRLDQIIDFITVIIAVFITLYIWGVDEMIYAALTTIGVIGVMLGFAIKDIASNFISGILLILSRDLLVGDDVEVNGVEGTIEKIAIRTTSIRRYDGALALVPNSLILNHVVIDYHATDVRRVELPVVLSSTTDLKVVTELLKEVAEKEPRRLQDKDVAVVIKSFGPAIVTLELRFWVARGDLTSVKSDTHDRIQRAFWEKGLTLDLSQSVELTGSAISKSG